MITLLLLAFAFLILPTNLPVNFDGIPLDSRPEITSLMALVSLGLWLLVRWTFHLPLPSPKRALSARVAMVLLTSAIGVKFFFSPTQSIATCATVVGISPTTENCINKTVPNLHNIALGTGPDLTPFPLGGINNLSFNHHYCDPVKDPVCKGLQTTRMDLSYPFNLRLDIPAGFFAHSASRELQVKYRGTLQIQSGAGTIQLPFAENTRTETIPVSADSAFTIRFRNYACAQNDAKWAECESLWNFSKILPFQQSQIQVLNPRAAAPHGISIITIIIEALAFTGLALGILQWLPPIGPIVAWRKHYSNHLWRHYLTQAGVVIVTAVAFIALKKFHLPGNCTGLAFTVLVALTLAPLAGGGEKSKIEQITNRILLACFALAAATIVSRIPSTDFLIPLTTGDDQLTYSSWSRDLNASGVMTSDSSIVLSKPFFLVLYATLNRLFGDLNGYNMTFQTWLGMSLALASLVIFAGNLRFRDTAASSSARILKGALAILLMAWFSSSAVSAFPGVQYLSEMCLWFVALPTIAALCAELGATTSQGLTSTSNRQWLAAIGAALMIAMRTQSVVIVLCVGVIAFIVSGTKALPLALKCFFTTATMSALIAARFAMTPTTLEQVRAYARANTIHDVSLMTRFLQGWTDTIYDRDLVWILATLTVAGALIAKRVHRPLAYLTGPVTILLLYIAQNPLKVTGVRQLYLNGWATAFLAATLIQVAIQTGTPRVRGRNANKP